MPVPARELEANQLFRPAVQKDHPIARLSGVDISCLYLYTKCPGVETK
jgi:hypothetical protein